MLLGLRLLAVVVLYAFLLVIAYVIWRDLRSVARGHHSENVAAAREETPLAWLQVVNDTDATDWPKTVFTVVPPATLGRASDNQVVLQDEWVSAYHARIEIQAGKWWLTDLGSRNGTRLNDMLIVETTPLTKGDIISVGRLKLRFETGDGMSLADPNKTKA